MVLKPMIYEIIVFMVGFYPGSIKIKFIQRNYSLRRDTAL